MICVKKEIETHNGLFRIGAVVLNEEETWKDDKVKPICADNDFMLHFREKGHMGVHAGKKHFRSVEEAEAYIWLLDINGFSVMDL
ncbi:MAG: hypothetical protein SOV76_04585 [Treponema succinifaciens]|uniref:hypothetical protein n=1 Tax=Treponema succinifaciens TaxID=167 RepID=UPI002A74B593|nr:hypothetical protein [Treponema succinifaciens]MDY2615819.1 hypothetical protein [Treponema succinifaciens]